MIFKPTTLHLKRTALAVALVSVFTATAHCAPFFPKASLASEASETLDRLEGDVEAPGVHKFIFGVVADGETIELVGVQGYCEYLLTNGGES